MRSHLNHRFLLLCVLQLLPVLWLCRDFVFQGKLLMSPEILDMSLPWARYLDQVGWHFEDALWDRTSFCGIPFLANPAARTFYPPDLVLRLLTPLSPEAVFSVLILFHAWMLGIGGAVWARGFVRSPAAATLAGWLLVLNGYISSRTGLADPAFLFATAWMPWILHWMGRLDRRSGWLGLVVCGILEVLAGRPDLTFYLANLLIGYLLWKWVPRLKSNRGRYRGRRELTALAAAAVVVGLVTAIQTLPTLELQGHTVNRSGQANFDFASIDSLDPQLLLASLFPGSMGDPTGRTPSQILGAPGSYWGQGAGFHEVYFHLGVITLLLAVLGLASGRTRMTLFWFLVLCFSILLAMGKYSPVYRFFFDFVPGWDRFRVPARVLVVALLAVTCLASSGLDALLRRRHTPRLKWVALGFLLLWFLLGVLVFPWHIWTPPETMAGVLFWRPLQADQAILAWMVREIRSAIGMALGIGLVGFLVVRFVGKSQYRTPSQQEPLPPPPSPEEGGGGRRWAIPWLLPILVLVELGWTNGFFLQGMTQTQILGEFPDDPLIMRYKSQLSQGRLMLTGYTIGHEKRSVHPWFFPGRLFNYGVENVGGYGPFLLADYVEAFISIDPNQRIYNNGLLLFLFDLDGRNKALFNLFQVSAIISPDMPVPGCKVIQVREYEGKKGGVSRLFLNQVPDLYPRAFVYRPKPGVVTPAPEPALGSAQVVEAEAIHVSLIADTTETCHLALLESEFPGWRCHVNGKEVPIEPLAGTFRSIEIPPGHSDIRFDYQPRSWFTGRCFSLLGMILLVVFAALQRTRRRGVDSVSMNICSDQGAPHPN